MIPKVYLLGKANCAWHGMAISYKMFAISLVSCAAIYDFCSFFRSSSSVCFDVKCVEFYIIDANLLCSECEGLLKERHGERDAWLL